MAAPDFNPSPKKQFQLSKQRMKAHLELIGRPDLEDSLNTALLQYQWNLCKKMGNLNDAASNHFKIAGALEFLDEFKKLAAQPSAVDKKEAEGQLIEK